MKFKYIDVHSHLNSTEYDTDRDAVIARMQEQGIATITIGTTLADSQQAVELADKYENIFACIGVHPVDEQKEVFDETAFAELVKHPKVVAIGECGLDYFRLEGESLEEKARQKQLFEQQIQFALKYDKALMLHCRAAYEDVLIILESYKKVYGAKLRGNAHFFAGDWEQALRFVAIGFTISFTGVVTFARSYDEIIKDTPIAMILSETDAPFVAPIPYRGKRNEPTYVPEVVRSLAQIRGEKMEDMAQTLVSNAERIFKLSSF